MRWKQDVLIHHNAHGRLECASILGMNKMGDMTKVSLFRWAKV